MKVCLTKKVIGTPKHLVISEGKFNWNSKIPIDAWTLGPDSYELDVQEYAFANGAELSFEPPDPYRQMIKSLLGDRSTTGVRWDLIMPRDAFMRFVKNLYQSVLDLLENSNEWKYIKTFKRTQKAISSMQPISVKASLASNYIRSLEKNRGDVLRSFVGKELLRYSRKSLTGRITVVSGPRVLHLDKKYRNIIKSRFGKKGLPIQLDFVSLEPRVLLSVMGQDAPDDVYTILSDKFSNISRADLKRATMTVLYGGGINRLKSILGDSRSTEKIMEEVRYKFKLRSLEDRLSKEFEQLGVITNHYGRVIKPTRNTPSYLVACFTQSTAVDAALLAFANIIEQISDDDKIVPFGIVHDAIWLDVHVDAYSRFKEIKNQKISVPGLKNTFPISAELLSK